MLPANAFQGRNGYLADYLNVRIYVADQATPGEIAAAANVAARLTFEIHSIDLPIGFPLSRYDNTESSVAILIGSAALRFVVGNANPYIVFRDGSRDILAIPDIRDAELFARTLGSESNPKGVQDENETPRARQFHLSSLFSSFSTLSSAELPGDAGGQISEFNETTIVLGPDVRSVEVIDLAARIAFEASGCRIPLVITDEVDRLPPSSILIGRTNRYLKSTVDFHQSMQRLQQGQGRIEVDCSAGHEGSAIAIAGVDDAGEAAALSHVAERLPFVWDYGKEHLHLAHIEKDLRYFFSQRSEPGQSAAALCKARGLLEKLSREELACASLVVLVEGNIQSCVDEVHSQFPELQIHAMNLSVGSGPLIFEETHQFPWEVDEARRRIMKTVISAIHSGSAVGMDLRVSESPEIRELLAGEFRKLALDLGANPESLRINVLAAHKQAYCWIDEVLKPRLKQSAQIRIQYREITLEPAPIESRHRWLHELYPIDEVLSRDLGIPLDRITFQKSISSSAATYELTAEDASGHVILQESFEPRYVMRKMFDSVPDYAQVRVNTGWLHAIVDGVVIADEHVETDPEKFWNLYQSTTLRQIHEYLHHLYDGNPLPECAPHFDKLEVDLWLSEPDYRIGIGEERISTLEALHEDIYFETLLFFEVLGLHNPGRIIPRVHRAREGQGGTASIRFTGKAGPNPRVDLNWKDKDGKACSKTENLFPIRNGDPKITALTVQSGHAAVVSLEVTGVPDTADNLARFEAIRKFNGRGFGHGLSYENVDALKFGPVEIPRAPGCFKKPRIEPASSADGNASTPMVQWDTPIGPQECEQIVSKLAAFPEVRAFQAGTSFLGNSIWALEVVAPTRGKFISQARAIAAKPVLFVTGRQHANEVSSTSHILKLAELLATDREIRKLLDKVQFVLHPITNPDGAALVDELTHDTPDLMLHAGYLGALGSDVTNEQWQPYPQYPEAHVRPDLWKMWLPDIVLNPHGYPSHEWVQLFAGYTAWVKSRSVTARDWWIARGWFIPGFAYMERSRDAAFKILDRTTAAMKSHLGPWNEQMYRRFAKYGAHDPEVFKTQFCNGLLVYSTQKGLQADRDGFTFMQRYPEITVLETVTEVPDEVARGEWLKTLAQAGLEYSLANARCLAETCHAPELTIQHSAHSTTLKMSRRRPWQSAT